MDRAMLMDQIDFVRQGGGTKRYHTKSIIHENTVGHHSFGVAWFSYLLKETPDPIMLVMAALSHDLSEHITGDVSSPTKKKYPELAKMLTDMEEGLLEEAGLGFHRHLSEDDRRKLKIADCLDGMVFCINEMELGNKSVFQIYGRYCQYVEALKPNAHEWAVYAAVRLLKEKYVGR